MKLHDALSALDVARADVREVDAPRSVRPPSALSRSWLGFFVLMGLSLLYGMGALHHCRAEEAGSYRYADPAWKALIETHARGRAQFNLLCGFGDETLCESSKAWGLAASGECAQLQKEAKAFAKAFAHSKVKNGLGGSEVVAYVDAYTAWMCGQRASTQASADRLPLPGEWNSHEAYVALLGASRERVRANLLQRYDAHLAEHPNDVVASVERCGFIGDTLEVDEFDEVEDPALADCIAQLAEAFPHEEEAITFRLTHAWGDERVALAEQTLKDPAVRWSQVNLPPPA